MSCEYLLGLDELFDYKNQLMSDMLTDETILRLLSEDGQPTETPEELMYTQVFPYEYVPDVVEHGKTFICCEVDIRNVQNKTYLDPAIYIWVFTHKSKVRLPEGGVRTDKIASRITELINGSRMYGLGELNLQSVRNFSPVQDYQGRIMTFYTTDWNRLAPSKQKVPANRKHP